MLGFFILLHLERTALKTEPRKEDVVPKKVDLALRVQVATVLAERAGRLIKRYFERRASLHVHMKRGNDPVTTADLQADALIRKGLTRAFPADILLTEETADGNPAKFTDHPAVWIVDPLDGTKNFVHGIPNYAVSIAFVSRGIPLAGAIAIPERRFLCHWPYMDSREDLGRRGAYAYYSRLHVSSINNLAPAIVGFDCSKRSVMKPQIIAMASRIAQTGVGALRSMGSAVADSLRVAEGTLDAYFHHDLEPWDSAASALMIQKAGGRVTRLDGSPWNAFCRDMLASNGHLHNTLLKHING